MRFVLLQASCVSVKSRVVDPEVSTLATASAKCFSLSTFWVDDPTATPKSSDLTAESQLTRGNSSPRPNVEHSETSMVDYWKWQREIIALAGGAARAARLL